MNYIFVKEDFTLPVPTNDYGVFTGWLYNDEPITDSTGHSLTKWNFTSDITLTVDWTVKIYTVEDLLKMGTYLNGDFILMNDIDLSGVNWNPIGINSAPFTGHLDGNGHKISNLTIDTSNYTNRSSFGLLTNVTFTDCYHTFSSTSNFGKVTGTYISSKYGSTTYTDNMFWKEYNESTGKGSWIFSDNDYPKLFWE